MPKILLVEDNELNRDMLRRRLERRGYAVVEAPSMATAVELTKRFLKVHGDNWDIECEVRPIDGPEFGAEGEPFPG